MQEKQSKWKLRKAAKQLLCLVLCFAMLFTLAPQSYASEAEATTQSEETKTESKEVSEEVTTESKKETAEKKTEATEKTTETKPATTEEKTEATTEETTEAKKAAEEATTEATKEEKTEATTEANATKKAAKAPAKSAAADEADTEEDATNDAGTEDTSYISEFYVTTNKEAISNKGDTVQFYAHVYVNDATTETTDAKYTDITWEIADAAGLDPVSDYLSIDASGKLTLKKELTTGEEKTITVRATSKYDPDTSEDIEITIKPTQVRSIKISIDDSAYNKNGYALVGNTVQLTATVSPDNAVEKEITSWKSSDTSVATVDANGKVTAVKQGKVTITAETKNGTKATQELIVYNGEPQEVKIPVWVTNKNKNTTASITLPVDGTAVNVSELQSTVTSGEDTYLYTGVVRYKENNSDKWETIQKFKEVKQLRYYRDQLQYTTDGTTWRTTNASNLMGFYEQGYVAKDADTQAKVSVGDWPGTFEECGNDDNKSIQVLVVNDETGKTEFTSETMLYYKTKGNDNDGWIGKIKLNCDESVYEITTVDIACSYNENSTNPRTIKTGVSYKDNVSTNLYQINSDGVSVKFTGTNLHYEEHYIITAHVKAKTYNVEYNGDGATAGVPVKDTKKMTEKSITVASDIPVREGYIFDGWSYGDPVYHAGNTIDTSSVKAGETVELIARWISKSEMVHYKAQTGGTVSSSYQRIKGDTTIKGSTAKAKDGYIFDGWYEGDTKVSDDIKYIPNKDAAKGKTYTAHFKKVVVDAPSDHVYDGAEHKWVPTVKTEDGKTLVAGTDYEVSYDTEDFVNVKTITVTITEKATNNGKVTKTYKITPAKVTIKTESASKVYDGDPLTAGGKIEGLVAGEKVNFTVTGSQTDVGESDNTYTLKWDKSAKESNYTIEKTDIGKLTVTETTDEIVVTTTGGEFTYDGKAHGATVKVTGLPKGYTVQTATSSATATDVTKEAVAATADNLVIVNKKGEDVTSKLKIKKVDGTIKINPATLTVTTPDKSKVYDGTALTAEGSISGLVNGETATFATTGTQTAVGSSSNTYNLTWDGTAKQSNYKVSETLGTLTVTKQSITPGEDPDDPDPNYKGIKINDPQSTFYDGETHQWEPTVKTKDDKLLVKGTDYTVSYKADGKETTDFTNAKTIKVTITGTGNYSGTVTKSYEIKKRTVTLTSATDSKVYDGTALTNDTVTATTFDAKEGTGFVEGENANYNVTGSQTAVGSSNNTFTYTLKENTKASNYTITTKEGTLTVTQQRITPNPEDPDDPSYKGIKIDDPKDEVYDGAEHKWAPTVTTADGKTTLVEGTDYTITYDTTNFKDVKTITVTIKGTGNYTGEITKTYNITKAPLTVTTESANKVYDGEALTATGTITGFVAGETYTFTVTGSQTDVGSSSNTYTLAWGGTAKESNYEIKSETLGTLTVTENADEIVVTTTGGEFTYDGKAHGATVTVSELPKGYTVQTATSSATATDVTTEAVKATADNLVIVNKKGEDVTFKLKIKKVDGTIKINPATLTVTTPDASKVYDGTALTAAGSISGFVNNETAKFTTTGSQTIAGESKNTYAIDWNAEKTTAKKSNYTISETLGTLKVTKQSITPNPDDPDDPSYKGIQINDPKDTVYNGQEQAWKPIVTDKNGNPLIKDKDFTVTFADPAEGLIKCTDAQTVTATVTGIGNYTGEVTKSYKITPRTVTLTSASDSKTYDGTALTNDTVTATEFDEKTGVGFVEGEDATYDVTGSQTLVGTSDNTFSYALTEKTKASNYAIEQKFGELSVTDKDVPSDKVIKKTHDADKSYAVGDTVVFTITVKNIYDAKKTITITEQEGVTITGDSVFKDVEPGAEVKTTAEYKVTEADIVKGSFKNTATATFDGDGTTPSTPSYSGEDTVDEFTKNAHITVSKVITNEPEDGESYKTGETITYKITVKNDGDITVTGVTVKDALTGDSWQIEKLAVGESKDFNATYKVTEKDAKAGEVTNVATAEAKDGTGDEVTVVDGKVTTKTSKADDTTEDTTEEEETTEETTEKKTTTKSTKKTAAKTTKKSAAAKTGDESKILYYMTAMLVAGAYIFFMLFDRRKEEE